jgi:hypothetical protein
MMGYKFIYWSNGNSCSVLLVHMGNIPVDKISNISTDLLAIHILLYTEIPRGKGL